MTLEVDRFRQTWQSLPPGILFTCPRPEDCRTSLVFWAAARLSVPRFFEIVAELSSCEGARTHRGGGSGMMERFAVCQGLSESQRSRF